MYALFPGQMIYVALFHPKMALEPKKFSGRAFLSFHVKAKVSQTVTSSTCQKMDFDVNTVLEAHKNHEKW